MRQFFLFCVFAFFLVTSLFAQNSNKLSEDTTIIAGKIAIIDGDEILAIDEENNIDSLLSVWYIQRALLDTSIFAQIGNYDLPMADLPDEVYINRLKALPCIIDLPYNHVVRNQIVYYTQKMKEKAEMILGLAEFYFPMIEEILDLYDMPLELRNMAVIESALNPRAVSRAKAKGLWQFMYGTAKLYNLTMNSFVEERFDPVASTHAAARHMRDLYNIFGDWSLAIAAYNCGAGNVNKAIKRSGGKRDYWDIYPYLPRETRGYVPAFAAANYLLSYYKEHGLVPKQLDLPPHIDTFMVNKPLHFEQVSEMIGIPVDELRKHNPQYVYDIIPGNERPYILRIPHEYTSAFAENEREIYVYKDSVYFNPNIIKQIAGRGSATPASGAQIIHRVKSGETLSTIANRYGVKINDLKYWNGINGTTIRAGQKLVVYGKSAAPKPAVTITTTTASAGKTTTTTKPTSGKAIVHTVKKGETLWNISQKYDDVTFYEILKLNGFSEKQKIFPGDKIRIK
ncbi:MAG: LysM peptidoglycan-binding domain-containing protein [Prevotellaceae bacterium]|jgi:membrane-bound lytic murein transglycosylase D|nr:LysM peptidoglycan-binding domain-containing protein [Prevotellaceae bacterium]